MRVFDGDPEASLAYSCCPGKVGSSYNVIEHNDSVGAFRHKGGFWIEGARAPVADNADRPRVYLRSHHHK
jgi:hypothetical protein